MTQIQRSRKFGTRGELRAGPHWVTLNFAIPVVPALRVTGLSEAGRAPTSQYRNNGQQSPFSGLPALGLWERKKGDVMFKVCPGRCLGLSEC